MNYEYFFVQHRQEDSTIFRVYSANAEHAVLVMAQIFGCKDAKTSLDAEIFLGERNVRHARLETIFGNDQTATGGDIVVHNSVDELAAAVLADSQIS
jgi:hypothetical protein